MLIEHDKLTTLSSKFYRQLRAQFGSAGALKHFVQDIGADIDIPQIEHTSRSGHTYHTLNVPGVELHCDGLILPARRVEPSLTEANDMLLTIMLAPQEAFRANALYIASRHIAVPEARLVVFGRHERHFKMMP